MIVTYVGENPLIPNNRCVFFKISCVPKMTQRKQKRIVDVLPVGVNAQFIDGEILIAFPWRLIEELGLANLMGQVEGLEKVIESPYP